MKTTSRENVQQKRAGREVIFLEHWFAGSGVRKPRREIKGSALDILFWRFKAHKGVCAVPSKSQWKNIVFWKGKFKSNLGKVCFFYQHCFTKVIDTYCCDEKHGKQLSIITPLVKNNTHFGNRNHTTLPWP